MVEQNEQNNSHTRIGVAKNEQPQKPGFSGKKKLGYVLAIAVWSMLGFYLAQLIIMGALFLLARMNVSFAGINESVLQAGVAALVYVLALVIVVGVPWWVKKYKTTKEDIGLQRLPLWRELLAAPIGFIAYVITSGIVISTLANYVPAFDVQQAQDVGFDQLTYRYEYILAFITLVIVAPVAEEILFRGYLYGKLKKYTFRWVAIILTSALFGLAHGQWNVAVDTFILSIALCLLRDLTGSLWPAIILHMIKNGLAYYLLFVNPSIINSLGG